MKNLKKVGAVALAAVMAVTFAPVASLNAFAEVTAPTGGDEGTIDAASDEVTKPGRYKLSQAITGTVTISANATVDLQGANGATTNFVVQKGATLTLLDSTQTYSNGAPANANVKSVTLGVGETASDGKDSTSAGNVVITKSVKQNSGAINVIKGNLTVNGGSVASIVTKKVPEVSGTTNDQDVKALQGKSSITINGGEVTDMSFESENVAYVLKGKDTLKANSGITINGGKVDSLPKIGTATAENPKGQNGNFINITGGVFATNFDTFNKETGFTADGLLNSTAEKALPIAVNDLDSVEEYYVGNAAIQNALVDGATINVVNGDASVANIGDTTGTITNYVGIPDTTKILKGSEPTVKATSADGVSLIDINTRAIDKNKAVYVEKDEYYFGWPQVKNAVEGLESITGTYKEYLRQLKVTYKTDSKDGKYDLSGNANTWSETTGGGKAATNLTYFDEDPSDRVEEGTQVALIDDMYYVIGKTQSDNALSNAHKSVKILKTNGWAKKTENTTENQEGFSAFNVRPSVAVNVTGPDDTMVVIYNPTSRSLTLLDGEDEDPSAKAWVFGKDADLSGDPITDDRNIDGVNVTAAEYIVNGVVGDELKIDDVGAKVTIKTADGIDWYTDNADTTSTNNEYDYHFAKTEKANELFKNALVGYTSKEGVKVDPTITGAVRVSTGISGKFEGVTTGVSVDAEWAGGTQTSTLASDKKSRTWVVNGGDVSEYLKMYRFRNTITGEHFYACDEKEVATLQGDAGKAAGWVDETEDKNTYNVLPATSEEGVAVYRLFNSIANEHFFTTDKAEADAAVAANCGWTLEGNNGVAFKAAPADTDEATVTVYRMHRPSDDAHLFTPDEAEVTWLLGLGQGWEKEGKAGVAYYGFK